MTQPYSVEQIEYICKFIELKYARFSEMLMYSKDSISSLLYNAKHGLCPVGTSYRARLLLTYFLNEYMNEYLDKEEFERIVEATNQHLIHKAKEEKIGAWQKV